jgi:hypothetical protein
VQPVATGGRCAGPENGRTVALGCHRLRPNLDGKEGVDGSSPSEGSAKAPHVGAFAFRFTFQVWQRAVGMEPSMELSCSERCGATRRERDSDDGVQTSIALITRVPAGVAPAVDRLRRCGEAGVARLRHGTCLDAT